MYNLVHGLIDCLVLVYTMNNQYSFFNIMKEKTFEETEGLAMLKESSASVALDNVIGMLGWLK